MDLLGTDHLIFKVKNKNLGIQCILSKPFFPGSYKGLQITQNLTCIKHVDLIASSVLNLIIKLERSIGIFVQNNCCITCSIGS